ncbi:MAG: M81 family metallopeptidase [Chloroflexota bacterium]|nr:M81 family metallopeptidase [Chloroflexota bacterium]
MNESDAASPRPVRLAMVGIAHETNTYSDVPADLAAFEADGILRGSEIVAMHATASTTVAGFLEAGTAPGVEVVPLLYTSTGPCGTITADAFETIVGEMIALIRDGGPWDGVLLAQHGAAVSVDFPDADGEVAARVRSLVGPDMPVGMALDMHGNVSHKMIDATTVTTIYRTNPHVDARVRARECADLIVRTVRGEVRPVQHLETPPIVINIVKQYTGEEPMATVVADAIAVEAWPGVLSTSVAEGYPYADVVEMGMAFLVIADGDPELAARGARWMASRSWERRAEFVGDIPSPAEAIAYAAGAPHGPVVIMDVGDNIGGGGPADSTLLLDIALRTGVRDYLQTLYDPAAVEACVAAGVGATVSLAVGGHTNAFQGNPVPFTGKVRAITDGKWEDWRPTHGGARFFDAGTMAVLEGAGNVTIVLTSNRCGNTSIEQMYSCGVRPERKQVVVAKGVVSPRPAYQPIAAEIVLANTAGVTSADLHWFEYERRRHPLFPFEGETAWSPGDR